MNIHNIYIYNIVIYEFYESYKIREEKFNVNKIVYIEHFQKLTTDVDNISYVIVKSRFK